MDGNPIPIGNGDWGCTEDKRLDVAAQNLVRFPNSLYTRGSGNLTAQNPSRTYLLKLGVGDLLGGDLDQSGGFPGAGGKEGTEVSARLKQVNLGQNNLHRR